LLYQLTNINFQLPDEYITLAERVQSSVWVKMSLNINGLRLGDIKRKPNKDIQYLTEGNVNGFEPN